MNNNNSIDAIKKKQVLTFALVIGVLICILMLLFFIIGGSNKKNKNIKQDDKVEFASAIKHVDAGSVLIERTEARLAVAEKSTEGLQKNVEDLNNNKLKQEQDASIEQDKINKLVSRIEELEKVNQEHATTQAVGATFPGAPGSVLTTQGIRDDAITLYQGLDNPKMPAKNPKDYVPSGTFVKAITLGGADASAAVNAQSNPQPMLFRIVEDGTMPNNKKSHLKGCLATAAVVGDISSERGFIRLETLSCVEPETNRIIDMNVEGTVFGSEGKSGIRGIPMWREGALLQRAFAAGALSGLASGMAQKYTKTSISPLGAVQSIGNDTKDILAQGAAGGLGNAMEKLADYNIKRAEQYHPVLQLSAGTVVDLVFLKGFYLNDPKQDFGQPSLPSSTATVMPNTGSANNNVNSVPSEMGGLPLTAAQVETLKKYEKELKG